MKRSTARHFHPKFSFHVKKIEKIPSHEQKIPLHKMKKLPLGQQRILRKLFLVSFYIQKGDAFTHPHERALLRKKQFSFINFEDYVTNGNLIESKAY